ncbi:oxidoreductase ['Osedax' symbiont bacterium Rs2_46_30_T18]|mgnify:CR=1 FL=1|nr:oxidoreductase ['Osedax' symbiont bacterium Rs2_46_30_T18]
MTALRTLVVGLGQMGLSHAMAYHNRDEFEIVGLVNRSQIELPEGMQCYDILADFELALEQLKPDLVSINTYSDSHANMAKMALLAGAHVFIEKPLATTVEQAEEVVELAIKMNKKLIVGYILNHHPSWQVFVEQARSLGGPYVMRMNLNQQSSGNAWEIHKKLMQTISPIVDCGVHYVDIMCQITSSKPVRVTGMGVRLSDEIADDMYNYGHLQVVFADGSVGWYEAGWGPMISETAFFVKDVMSPNGAVSIVADAADSADVDAHTKTSNIRVHQAALDSSGKFVNSDQNMSMQDEPGHNQLCELEQLFVYRAIREDLDLSSHMQNAVESLRICLAADESIRTNKTVYL